MCTYRKFFGIIFMLHKNEWWKYWIWDTDLTSAGQFLRSVRKDEFGPTEMQFDTKTEVSLRRLRTGHVELNSYLYRFNGLAYSYLFCGILYHKVTHCYLRVKNNCRLSNICLWVTETLTVRHSHKVCQS